MPHAGRDTNMQAALTASETMHKLWRMYFMHAIHQGALPGAPFAALYLIQSQGPLSSRKLGEALLVTPGAVTQLVDLLVEQGLVERQPNQEDRRVINLSVTKAGQEKINAISRQRRALLEELFSVLSDEELASYLAAQRKMIAQLQNIHQTKATRKETHEDETPPRI